MLIKTRSLVFLLITLMFLLVGCQKTFQGKEYYTFTDDLGVKIRLEEKPQRVAVLFSSYVEIWILAGGEVSITVGESIERQLVKNNLPLVDEGAGKNINSEILLALSPDFVICSADIEAQVSIAKLLNNSDIPAACFKVEEFEDYLRMLKICTDITKNTEAYITNGLNIQQEIDQILKKVSDKPTNKKILFIRAGSTASSTKAKNASQHFVAGMLKELKTENIADVAWVLLDGLSVEEILIQDPEYIFISTMGNELASKNYINTLFSDSVWKELSAVKNQKYIFLPKELFQFKPNVRWAEAYQYLMDVLYEEE